MWPGPYGDRGSRKYLLASLDQSLGRMGLDYVDIFYSHRVDPDTRLEETMGALDSAVRQGKALYVGHLLLFGGADARGRGDPAGSRDAVAHPSAVLLDAEPLDRDRSPRRPGGGTDRRHRVLALAQGLLTDRYLAGVPAGSRVTAGGSFKQEYLTDANLANVRGLNEIAQRRGQTLAQMALAWTIRDPRVASAVVGASSVAQLDDDLAALEHLAFEPAELAEIDRFAVDGGLNLWAQSSNA